MLRRMVHLLVIFTYIDCSTSWCYAADSKDTYPSITKAIKEGIYSPTSGIGAGIAGSIVHIVARILNGSWLLVSTVASYCTYMSQRGFNRACARPDPLDTATVQCWHDMVEQITNGLCEQAPSGALMLRSLRVQDMHNSAPVDNNWLAYRELVQRVFEHIIVRIADVLPYYEGGRNQRTWLVSLSHGMVAQDRTTIVFLLHEVIRELTTIIELCMVAQRSEDLSIDEIRRVSRTTLLLLKKIHLLIAPIVHQDTLARSVGGLGNSSSRFDNLFV